MMNALSLFEVNVFNDKIMRDRLPNDVYLKLKKTINQGMPLERDIADIVANAMKDWAIERGATHYTHWFQPLTGITAEKHDAFLSTLDGVVTNEFSGKQLIQGESDASSFPSGGLRATFEARGYTAWDCTSPAFLKEDAKGGVTLYIPTAYCGYNGEALDRKTPLHRANSAINKHALRMLKALGVNSSKTIRFVVGAEQEYFLIDKTYYEQRIDLMFAGRTLFGAMSPKGQELEDQYFGSIKDRITEFMKDLDRELWKLGVLAKTKHNETAPAQYEMAPIYSFVNVASDHNQLVMETMQRLALRHDLVCLLHEKPFSGVSGSGKHNNFSLITDDGINLFEPGSTPQENLVFLATLAALIKSIDTHADILRATTASASNDHRLGASEAPPAIISIFLGDALSDFLEQLEQGALMNYRGKTQFSIGADTLPELPRDNTDRNRTSPFAFTGNKFEFRMLGSSSSISGCNVVLMSILAEAFDGIADRLEASSSPKEEVLLLLKETYESHKRVIYDGNNYAEDWLKEAERRGLHHYKTTVESLEVFLAKETEELFGKYGVFTKEELRSRYEIYMEQYCKTIHIEGKTACEMIRTQYFPAVFEYVSSLALSIKDLKVIGGSSGVLERLLARCTESLESAERKLFELENAIQKAFRTRHLKERAILYRDEVLSTIYSVRIDIDVLEGLLPKKLWPVPSYSEMLFLSATY